MNERTVQEIRHWPRSVRHRYGNDATLIHDYDERPENAENISLPMHVITRKRLNEFAEEHPESRTALVQWYLLAKRNSFSSFANLKLIFPAADRVGKFTVFDVGGNKVRIVAAPL